MKVSLSVIVPVFNTAQYLPDCIRSILSQATPIHELILVDDGSTDGSAQICDFFASYDNVKVIHQPNRGQSAARNAGLDVATGNYVTFVDSDDMLHPDFHITWANGLNGEIIVCNYFEGATCSWRDVSHPKMSTFTGKEALKLMLYQDGFDSSACAKLIPIELLRQNRFVEGLYYEDLDLMARIYASAKAPVVKIDADMYFYRTNPTSFINTFDNKRLDVLKVTKRIEQDVASDPVLLKAAHDRRFSANCNMFILSSRAGLNDVAQKCWDIIKSYRSAELADSSVRIKNKLGALLSYFGPKMFVIISRFT